MDTDKPTGKIFKNYVPLNFFFLKRVITYLGAIVYLY